MFCNKCGNEIDTSAKFCNYCGAIINNQPQTVNCSNNINTSHVKTKKKIYQQWWFWIMIILTVIAMIGVTTNKYDTVTTSNSQNNISDTSQTYYIGDTIKLGDFSVKLESYKIKKRGDRIDDYSVVDDPQWIAIFLTYKNISGKEKRISRNVRLINGNGEELEQPIMYYNVWNGEHLDNANLIEGGSKTGFLVFTNTKVDKAENLKLQISASASFNKKSTYNFKLIKK